RSPLTESMRIAGERVGSARTLDVHNPYTGDVVGTVPRASVDDIRRAFAVALRAPRDLPQGGRTDRGARDATLGPDHRRVRDLQEGFALRGRPRARCLHVRRQRGAPGRRPGLLLRPDAAWQVAE